MSSIAEIEHAIRELPIEEARRLLDAIRSRLVTEEQSWRDFRINPPSSEEVEQGRRALSEMQRDFKVSRFTDPDSPASDADDWDALQQNSPKRES
ncbi:MAG: hypothetical protein AAGI46_06440 [Planctomycetota bacterium]